jgi:hypothetical protein
VSLSLNEVENLVRKAARGAGLDPGRADDLAAASAVLASHGLPVCAIIYRALTGDPGQPLMIAADGAQAICPATSAARAGSSALDLLLAKPPGFEVTLDAVDEPLLIAALAVVAARPYASGFAVTAQRATLTIERDRRTDFAALENARSIPIVLRRLDATAARPSRAMTPASRYDPEQVSDDGVAGLERLARMTYVPASDASRLKGAGAGLTDND